MQPEIIFFGSWLFYNPALSLPPLFSQGTYSCQTWIWVDLVRRYVDKMVKWRQTKESETLKQDLASAQDDLAMAMQTVSGLKLQIASMHSQLAGCHSASMKIKILRLCLVFAAIGLFITPGSLTVAATVMGIAAIMFLVKI